MNVLVTGDDWRVIFDFQLTLILPIKLARLTHWGQVTHICVNKVTIIGSDNGLSPGRRQAIIWTNAGLLLIGPVGTNFSETLINIQTFSFRKMHLKMSSGKWRPFCLGLYVLTHKRLETFRCAISTVATDVPMLKHRLSVSTMLIKYSLYCTSFIPKYNICCGKPPRGVENRNLLSHPDDLRMEAYVIRMR